VALGTAHRCSRHGAQKDEREAESRKCLLMRSEINFWHWPHSGRLFIIMVSLSHTDTSRIIKFQLEIGDFWLASEDQKMVKRNCFLIWFLVFIFIFEPIQAFPSL
jgi:hypothetical protein